MREVVRCGTCGMAARKPHFGFTGQDVLYCTGRSGTVEEDDGCTFGYEGIPGHATADTPVDLGSNAAVNGHHWC